MERAKRLFKAWRGGTSDHGPAPQPGEGLAFEPPAGETLVDVVYAQSGAARVGISKDGAGVYRLRGERWAPEWDVTGEAAWSAREEIPRTGKTPARAQTIAREWLEQRGEALRDETEE